MVTLEKLYCSTNNKKETVLKHFEEAIADYGDLSRIRTGKRGENTIIWEIMTEIKDNGTGTFLASPSVYNQSIRRSCVDL